MKPYAPVLVHLSLLMAACTHAPETQPDLASASQFVGIYNGNSFETAMGMRIAPDGTFEWGLSVGALDMRASGTWEQQSEIIRFTSTPTPLAPEFRWSGLEKGPDAPFIKVVWATSGEPFRYADVRVLCVNGQTFSGQIASEGWSPPDACDEPETLILRQSIHDVVSEPFRVADFSVEPGTTIRFEFRPNDLGVADFTGATGRLEHGRLKISGLQWPLELRKVRADNASD